jgi:hypothetical protein
VEGEVFYYEELNNEIMEVEKSHNLPSASYKLRKVGSSRAKDQWR